MDRLGIFDILRGNERVLVYVDDETRTLYTWNQSVTLQAWCEGPSRDLFFEADIRTLSREPKDFLAARQAALTWAAGQ